MNNIDHLKDMKLGELVIGYEELSQLCGISKPTLRSRMSKGSLDVEVVGSIGPTLLFDRASAERFSQTCTRRKPYKNRRALGVGDFSLNPSQQD